MSKRKIINDPLYGFIGISSDLIFKLIEHPYFQRLRRIKQLGMTDLVYPGATHTRYHHALGAMHLMRKSISVLREKDVDISPHEEIAALSAILLHDLGHGPFSHSLEQILLPGIKHEDISLAMMRELNRQFDGELDTAIEVFSNTYPKKFLNQLVSGQLDMDRLDYLTRDSFYTGVSEGIVGLERIIQMLTVRDDKLVVEEKGIYSIEKFIIARRLMYWQVYLHKTTLGADAWLINILKKLSETPEIVRESGLSQILSAFIINPPKMSEFLNNPEWLDRYSTLDDHDMYGALKLLSNSQNMTVSYLCRALLNRKLPKVEISNTKFSQEVMNHKQSELRKRFSNIPSNDQMYLLYSGEISNEAYEKQSVSIDILTKNGKLVDLTEASDNYNISSLAALVKKYYLCTPK